MSQDAASVGAGLRATLRLRRPGGYALHVDLHLPVGVSVLLGPSGAGKSTTLDLLAGHIVPDEGEILLGSRVLLRWLPGQPRLCLPAEARHIGYVMQAPSLFPHLDVAANIAYGLFAEPRAVRLARVDELTETLDLRGLLTRSIASLSGGERQRVALARALAPRPRALLLDEPLSAVDLAGRDGLLRRLRELLSGLAIPVLWVTHSVEEQGFFAGSGAAVYGLAAGAGGAVVITSR